MSSSPFKNLVLPAIFISTTVFCTLNLTFISRKSESAPSPTATSEVSQPSPIEQSKDLLIRYVGLTIILSVGAGVATVEVLRKWQAFRESTRVKQIAAIPNSVEELSALPESSWGDESSLELHPPIADSLTDWAAVEPDPLFGMRNQTVSAASSLLTELPSLGVDTAPAKLRVLDARHQYQTCRVKVPHLPHHLFAISLDGQYYTLSRTAVTKEQALKFADRLTYTLDQVIVTTTLTGFAVWGLQPDAYPELAA